VSGGWLKRYAERIRSSAVILTPPHPFVTLNRLFSALNMGILGIHTSISGSIRNAVLGAEELGREAFKRLVNHPAFRHLPFIPETPIEEPGDDLRNLAVMRGLMGGPKTKGKGIRQA
jgi:hypothetical protein